ncbi:efflux RND transporter permease subunit [Acidocella aminolytica]|uniref:Multidrug resistance efflux pump acriflavin resistance protein n=1 Tax=Acidocella aminolytica 101 = DSM 11237 TaxID=1120923 RepID=A0A0D6PDE6_9PROT|nr:efflux RND transporter permease subunit [Acidocella aminolytica]GAN78894.1 multidrug resistance efflux pump acriflavin resistance protein [Acidocella aminolytica 101 = DSM 11237]GBQ42285.1 multidrug efflux pump acriflavin resistance protein AcrB/AcrD/AcrF [Acidocella aminolytica 101 = DSM 11237]SHE98672.1 multidrug efflux pump [Acidocella aminolytica 101 = DSM 11237]
MNIPAIFIRRPVATILLTIGIALSGILAFTRMPVAPLPKIAFPTIQVMAQMAGASPETMASTVAAPLERHLGAISGVTEMTSQSGIGSTRIVLQFRLSRDINGAARDVEAAIQAARADLPTSLRANPTYHEFNPADAPIMILSLTSGTMTPAQLYDSADTVLGQKFSQVTGVGEVELGGSALPAVRVELQPGKLAQYGIGLEDVRAALAAANANSPKGYFDVGPTRYQLYTNDQATRASQYRGLVVAYRNGEAVKLSDVAKVENSVENTQNAGLYNGKSAVLVIIHGTPDANIIKTVDAIKALLPELKAALPPAIHVAVAMDRSQSIRAAVDDTERTLFIAVLLVVGVVFVFLRSQRATLIPGLAVPVSIIGAFGPMYLLGFSIDNLSLMALTIATGFVVDDAVVVTENTMRHLEAGMAPVEAALRGGAEVGFTVLSMSLSLIAVFVPILLLPGLVGMLFREFAETLCITILISLLVSLTTTPMLCALLLRPIRHDERKPHRLLDAMERGFSRMRGGYEQSLRWALRHSKLVGFGFLLTIILNIALFVVVPKGFFPQQDTGLLIGNMQADQSISFAAMKEKMAKAQAIIEEDPAVESVSGFTGGRSTNSAFVFVTLKPRSARLASAAKVVARLRGPLSRIAGARTFLVPAQDLRAGGRQSNAEYQYTLTSDSLGSLKRWVPKIVAALKQNKALVDVNSDLQSAGLETDIRINRAQAARFGITPEQIDATLYDAFGQRTVSTIYNELNQYEVVMEFAPRYQQTPADLARIYVSTTGGTASGTASTQLAAGSVSTGSTSATAATTVIAEDSVTNAAINSITGIKNASSGAAVSTNKETMVPLSAFATISPGTTPITVNHQGGQIAATISFSLPPGVALGTAAALIQETMNDLHVPLTIKGGFAGTAAVFESSQASEPLIILAALAAVYIVLGILYESTIHPLTILSTIPSAGVGATLFLLMLDTPLTIIALIGVILLIGIVKKNAILMIDFALALQRGEGLAPEDAIFRAASLRLRPILMTTFAAVLGALPLAIGIGQGAALRQPLGLTIIGGLLVSQALTLYTTPVLYLWLERLATKLRGGRDNAAPRSGSIVEVP